MYQLLRNNKEIAVMDDSGSWAIHVDEVKTFCKHMLAMLDFDSRDPSVHL